MDKASFDERMAVTGLLLAKLTDGFKALKLMNEEMTLLMAQLKQFKKESDGADVTAIRSSKEALSSLSQISSLIVPERISSTWY